MDFQAGVTKISGANESGKSLVFEMIRYALFGTKALRGSAADYKAIWVELVFQVSDVKYTITRTSKDATLLADGKFVARSTTAVNAKIIEIVGYGLKTFDNVNSITQNEIEKLTKLEAKDRKKFVDELIGAEQIDSLVREYKAEAQIVDAEVKALSMGLQTLEPPKKPSNYSPTDVFDTQLKHIEEKVRGLELVENRVALLQKQIDAIIIVPDPCPDKTKEELQDEIDNAEQCQEKKERIRKEWPDIVRLHDAGLVLADFSALQKACDTFQKLHLLPRVTQTYEQLVELEDKWVELENWHRIVRLKEQLADLESCPRCGKSFDKEKAPIVDEINQLEPKAKPHRGLVSKEAIAEAKKNLAATVAIGDEIIQLDDTAVRIAQLLNFQIPFTPAKYDEVLAELKSVYAVSLPKLAYASLGVKQKVSEKLALELSHAVAVASLEQLDPDAVRTEYSRLRLARHDAANYEMQLAYWTKAQAKNDELKKVIDEKVKLLEDSRRIAKALSDFKYYINTYFLPAVAKAASTMLKTMTNGVRKRVMISDKFEIIVDGQAVETLSGSAKALVNISLRLALQFVLTKNTFSVFMGDEIDAAMDEHRAKYLSECLTNMTEHIKQIIVISHREIVADQQIKL